MYEVLCLNINEQLQLTLEWSVLRNKTITKNWAEELK